jgi:hypothetical protein
MDLLRQSVARVLMHVGVLQIKSYFVHRNIWSHVVSSPSKVNRDKESHCFEPGKVKRSGSDDFS